MEYQNVKNRMIPGGELWEIEGKLDIVSGGVLDLNGDVQGEKQVINVKMPLTEDVIDQFIFISDGDYEIVGIKEVHATAETTAASLDLQVEILSGTEAFTNGDDVLDSAIDLKGTADTVVDGTLTSATTLAEDDRLAVNISASGTEIAGVILQIVIKSV